MSNWTLKKIKACEEIKFGASFDTKDCRGLEKSIIIHKWNDGAFKWIDPDTCCDSYDADAIKKYAHDFKFYRPDGTEILPPEDKPKERRLYAYRMINHGAMTGRVDHFESEFSKNDLPAFYERAPEWDIVKSEGV